MNLIERYIGENIVRATGAAILVLALFFSFVAFIDELGDVGKGHYTAALAGLHTLLSVPRLIYELFPPASLIGVMVGLGLMANNSELTVVRVSGGSLAQVLRAVAMVGAVLMLVSIVIGELVAPLAEGWAADIRTRALTHNARLQTGSGYWARDGQSFISIGGVFPDGSARNVLIYEFDEHDRLRVITDAGSASHDGEQWVLEDITQTWLDEKQSSKASINKAAWNSSLDPELISLVSADPEVLAASELFRYINWLDNNNQDTSRYQYALWSKIGYPLSTAVMIMLAVPFAFGSMRQMTMSKRIIIGVLIGTFFHLFSQTAGHLSQVFGMNPALSALGPAVLVLVLATALLRRAR